VPVCLPDNISVTCAGFRLSKQKTNCKSQVQKRSVVHAATEFPFLLVRKSVLKN
jgi:hypothetical protein